MHLAAGIIIIIIFSCVMVLVVMNVMADLMAIHDRPTRGSSKRIAQQDMDECV